ncbi:hypothetical protein EZS27_018394 [termite gut metagenome]|uniref:Uncharacterized protein n=1 Tax=termite gut metagenome TaxID=433724 RepID=A0A5J4RGJ7_9ZZZZ
MANVKLETIKARIEIEGNLFLSDESVSETLKEKFQSYTQTDEDLRKKYQILSNWKNRNNHKEKSDNYNDTADVKTIFKELRKLIDPDNAKLFDTIFNQTKDLLTYIETSEFRKLDEEEKRAEKEFERQRKYLEEIREKKKQIEKAPV